MFKTIREKLLASYLLIALIFALSGLVSIYHVSNMADMTTELVVGQWVTEKLFDNAQTEIDQIVQTVLDPDPQADTERLIGDAQEGLEEYILLFEETPLGIDVRTELIPLFRQVQQALAPALRLQHQPLAQRDKFDELLDQLLDESELMRDISFARQLTHIEWLLNDYLLKDDRSLLEEFDKSDIQIRANPRFPVIKDRYELLHLEGHRTFQLGVMFKQARAAFKEGVKELKASLARHAVQFDEQVVRPKGRSVNQHFSTVLLVIAGSVVCSIMLALFLGIFFANHLSRPLVKSVWMIEALERGNFDQRLGIERRDEIGRVAQAIDMFADSLQEALAKLDQEINERRHAEADAKENELKYRQLSTEFQTLLEGISDSIVLISPAGLVVWANRNTHRQINASSQSLVGCSVDDLSRQYHFYGRACCVEQTLATGLPQNGTFRCVDERVFGIKTFPLHDSDGELSGVIRMCSDITERIQLRQAAIETSRLASLGELAAGVAHEINNPNALTLLNAPFLIDAFTDILAILDEYAAARDDFALAGLPWAEVRDEIPCLLQEMLQGGQRIQRIVDDLKDFVRQGGAAEFELMDVNDAVDAAVRLLHNQIKNSTDNFSLSLSKDLPRVRGNMQQIQQVVVNLAQNACHALASRDALLHIATRLDTEQGQVLIQVYDEGRGIAEEHLPHLTEPFFTTRRNEGGTGLGLSISARIAKDHGGGLSFNSSPGQGTVAVFQLPAIKES